MIKLFFRITCALVLYGCFISKHNPEFTKEILINYKFSVEGNTIYDGSEMQGYFGEYFFIKKVVPTDQDSNGVITKKPDEFLYYLFQKNSAIGFSTFTEISKWDKINKDSLIFNQTYKMYERAEIFSRTNYRIVNAWGTGFLDTVKIGSIKKVDASYYDTGLYFFDKRQVNINFSIDKYMDSVGKSKCLKKRLLYYKKSQSEPYKDIVYKELSVEMQVGTYFRKAEADSLKQIFDKQLKML